MSKNSKTSSKVTQGLGGNSKKSSGLAGAAKAITKAVSKGKAPPSGFQGASPKTTGKMKPSTPIIGATRGKGANFATVNKDRMKGTIKELGM